MIIHSKLVTGTRDVVCVTSDKLAVLTKPAALKFGSKIRYRMLLLSGPAGLHQLHTYVQLLLASSPAGLQLLLTYVQSRSRLQSSRLSEARSVFGSLHYGVRTPQQSLHRQTRGSDLETDVDVRREHTNRASPPGGKEKG